MNLNEAAKKIFLETLRTVRVEDLLPSSIRVEHGKLSIAELVYDLRGFRRIFVIAIGKASGPMCSGIVPQLEEALAAGQDLHSIVVGPEAPRRDHAGFEYFPGSHPFPDHYSRQAADSILTLLSQAGEDTLVLFLISGGASAMVEKPLDPAMTADDVTSFYRALVHSGLVIGKMNALRKHFSAVKGGRLALAASPAAQCTLLVSDVADGLLDVIGSGPSLPDSSTVADCREILLSHRDALRLPEKLFQFFAGDLPETPKADDAAFLRSRWLSILSSADLARTASRISQQMGFRVVVDNHCDDWDFRAAARYLVDRLRQLDTPACLLSCGELSVPLTPQHGTGGRNQQFALECARLLAEENLSATVLSGGSDGIDGNSPAAGAVCDHTTWQRAASHGVDPEAALAGFDSFPLFQALGDAIVTGPTGNNLRDLRILLRQPA